MAHLSSAFVGVIAAAISPLMMTIGFIIWDKYWTSSAFSLNLFKCGSAGFLFFILSIIMLNLESNTLYNNSNSIYLDVLMLIISSIVGIVIGDNTWLLALQMIGPKRVIIIDTLKPFLASLLGFIFLNESLNAYILLGITMSTIGIVLVSVEKKVAKNVNETSSTTNSSSLSNLTIGYILSAINVVLDAFGSLLTKKYGKNMNTWDINFIRFGFAAICMLFITIIMKLWKSSWSSNSSQQKFENEGISSFIELNQIDVDTDTIEECVDFDRSNDSTHEMMSEIKNNSVKNHELNEKSIHNVMDMETELKVMTKTKSCFGYCEEDWFVFPTYSSMSYFQWRNVSIGIFFVTFLCPALSNYALFKIPLSLCLTLTSLGPIYSIPLVYIMSKEKTGIQGIIGSLLAFSGIVILCMGS
eukprot:gene15409-20790_t